MPGKESHLSGVLDWGRQVGMLCDMVIVDLDHI